MAKANLTSAERLAVYRAVFRLNCSFHSIVQTLHDLDGLQMFHPRQLMDMRVIAQQAQREINDALLDPFCSAEEDDLAVFAKVRAKRLKS